jgi:hypothetical protein
LPRIWRMQRRLKTQYAAASYSFSRCFAKSERHDRKRGASGDRVLNRKSRRGRADFAGSRRSLVLVDGQQEDDALREIDGHEVERVDCALLAILAWPGRADFTRFADDLTAILVGLDAGEGDAEEPTLVSGFRSCDSFLSLTGRTIPADAPLGGGSIEPACHAPTQERAGSCSGSTR